MYGSRLLHICENMWRFATCCKGGVTPPNVAAAALKRLGGFPPRSSTRSEAGWGGYTPPQQHQDAEERNGLQILYFRKLILDAF